MCLYISIQRNKKYLPTKKNGGNVPVMKDVRLSHIPARCGKCFECRKEKANEWKIRLSEELRTRFGYFITLTYSNESFEKLEKELGYEKGRDENTIATLTFRRFLERVRQDYGKSIRHWFVTELGEKKDRLHLHGVLFDQKAVELCRKHWKYGNIYVGSYCNERTINYITKYMLKYDVKHKDYTQIMLCSKGIGDGFFKRKSGWEWQKQHAMELTVPTYTFKNGTKCKMPKYYKDKIFTEEEREQMWLNTLDSGKTYIGGEKIDMYDEEATGNLRAYWRGYYASCMGDNPEAWKEQKEKRRREKWRRYINGDTSRKSETRRLKAVKEVDAKIKKWEREIYEIRREEYNDAYIEHVYLGLEEASATRTAERTFCPF